MKDVVFAIRPMQTGACKSITINRTMLRAVVFACISVFGLLLLFVFFDQLPLDHNKSQIWIVGRVVETVMADRQYIIDTGAGEVLVETRCGFLKEGVVVVLKAEVLCMKSTPKLLEVKRYQSLWKF
jgi:hypothetical protein